MTTWRHSCQKQNWYETNYLEVENWIFIKKIIDQIFCSYNKIKPSIVNWVEILMRRYF